MVQTVRLDGLKDFALHGLPPAHPLRDLLLGQPDELPVLDFLAKASDWLKLLKHTKQA